MAQKIKRLMGRIEMRVMTLLVAACLAGSIAYAATQFLKKADDSEFPVVNTWQDLINDYLVYRDGAYPLVPPDDVMSGLEDVNRLDMESVQADPEWYWTFGPNIYLFEESSELAKQIPHNTDLIMYEDMASGELLVYRAPAKETEDYTEEIVFRAPPWPQPGLFERPAKYLYRELSKRRIVWQVTLKSRREAEKEVLLTAKLTAAVLNQESGGRMMTMMYTGAVEEVTIVSMKKATNGLLLEIGYPSEYTGTSWSVYSYDAPACFNTNGGSGGSGGGIPTPPGDSETNTSEDCSTCSTDPEKSFMGLKRVWALSDTNLLLTGESRTSWLDSKPLAVDSNGNPCNRFYGLGNNNTVDEDNDGLNSAAELFIYKTSPGSWDTDGDQMPDGWEVSRGLNPCSPFDATTDTDGDGLANAEEYRLGTDPNNASDAAPLLTEARCRIQSHWAIIKGTSLIFTNSPGSMGDLEDLKTALMELSGVFSREVEVQP